MQKKSLSVLYVLVALAILTLLFALIDYFIHGLSPDWGVPEYYFKNKIIFGFLLSIMALFFTGPIGNVWLRAAIFSAVVGALLQVRYYLTGYPLNFVILFLFIHFAILYVLAAAIFYFMDKDIKNLFNKAQS